ncbi:MAG: hypothetical protein OHK0046_39240 [Anaerolineae bacterium]
MKIQRLLLCGLVLLMISLLTFAQDEVIWSLLQQVNAARAAQGVPALALNTQLIAAAQRHSSDMATNAALSHIGTDGSQFWQRIAAAGYNMTSGAENVLASPMLDASAAFEQWRQSEAHFANITNPVYVEAGVAYARSDDGTYYYTLILAARSDFTPLPVTPTPSSLPLSPTPSSTLTPSSTTASLVVDTLPAPSPTIIPSLTLVPLQPVVATAAPAIRPTLPATLFTPRPLEPTQAITYDLTLVYDAESFTLVNTGAETLYLLGLSFEGAGGAMSVNRWQTPLLSTSLEAFPRAGCLQVWGLARDEVLDAPDVCTVRHAWAAVNAQAQFWLDDFTVYRFGEAIGQCEAWRGECRLNIGDALDTAAAIPTRIPQDTVFSNTSTDVRLVYSPESFAIMNTSGEILDFTGLGFSGAVSIEDWNTQFLSRPLNAFTPGDCLQAWPLRLPEWPPKPAECDYRHAWIALSDTDVFWLETFSVSRNGVVLATCSPTAGMCDFDL